MVVAVGQTDADKPDAITDTTNHIETTQGGVHTREPLLGKHTDAMLAEAGFSESEIAQLRQDGAIE